MSKVDVNPNMWIPHGGSYLDPPNLSPSKMLRCHKMFVRVSTVTNLIQFLWVLGGSGSLKQRCHETDQLGIIRVWVRMVTITPIQRTPALEDLINPRYSMYAIFTYI